MRSRRRWERWDDPYAQTGRRSGYRCREVNPEWAARCVRERGHDGPHRYTSAADGRSVTWEP